MKRLILFLTVLIIGVSASALPTPAAAVEHWPPLLNCSDVNADGHVDGFDIGGVVTKFGTAYPSEDYLFLYDVWGGGNVDGFDIGKVVLDFGLLCPLVETQVAAAALATNQYADCQDALDDGYGTVTGGPGVYVPQMGIHISKNANLSSNFDPTTPFGFVCSATAPGSGIPDRLLGLWYIDPVPETCFVYFILLGLDPDLDISTCQDSSVQPVGFGDNNADEDNDDPDGAQSGWHTHINLCVGNFLDELGPAPNQEWHDPDDPQHECVVHRGGFINVPVYGWMLHLYTMVSNPSGRFMKWNANVP